MKPADIMIIAGALRDCVDYSNGTLKRESNRMKEQGIFGEETHQKPFFEHHVDWQKSLLRVCKDLRRESRSTDCHSTVRDACEDMQGTIAKSEKFLRQWREARKKFQAKTTEA